MALMVGGTSAREGAAAAIARSLHHQVDTARMPLQTADRFPTYEASHERFIHSAPRVLRVAEEQLWQVRLEDSVMVQLASELEGVWFAIDAHS
jgi:hypothetical protein